MQAVVKGKGKGRKRLFKKSGNNRLCIIRIMHEAWCSRVGESTISQSLSEGGAYVLASGCRYSNLCLHYYSGNRNEGGTTMNCPRCQGLMVVDVYACHAMVGPGCYIMLPMCGLLGNYEDSVILQHKSSLSACVRASPRMAGMVKR